MTLKKHFDPTLGAGTLLSWRVGFSELRDERKRSAPIGTFSINETSYNGGLTQRELLFPLKPKAPI